MLIRLFLHHLITRRSPFTYRTQSSNPTPTPIILLFPKSENPRPSSQGSPVLRVQSFLLPRPRVPRSGVGQAPGMGKPPGARGGASGGRAPRRTPLGVGGAAVEPTATEASVLDCTPLPLGPNSWHSFPTRSGSPGGPRNPGSGQRSRKSGSAPPPRPCLPTRSTALDGGCSRNPRRRAGLGCFLRSPGPPTPTPRGSSGSERHGAEPPGHLLPTCGTGGTEKPLGARSWRLGSPLPPAPARATPPDPKEGRSLSPVPPGQAIFRSAAEAGRRECHV